MAERKLSLRALLVGTSLVTQVTLLLLAGFLCYYAARSVLWHHGLQQMDWRLMSLESSGPASEVSRDQFRHFLSGPVELGKDWRGLATQISGGVYRVQLYDLSGQLVARSHSDLLLTPPSSEQLKRSLPQNRKRPSRDAHVADNRQILVFPITADGQLVGYGQMSNNWWPSHSVLNWLFNSLWFGLLCIVALTGSINFALVRLLARPLERLAACGRKVGAGDLQVRAQLKTRCSEIAQVGSTFDWMLERLQGVIQAQKGFVADVSHELRTPLTALAGQLHIANACLPADVDARVSRALQKAENEHQRVVDLVEDLLSLVRAENALPMDPVSLVELIEALVAQNEGVRLEHAEPLWVLGNLPALQRALGNLVQNALSYSETPPTLRLARDGDWARIDVEDRGPGIAPEHLEKLGERFYRVDPSRSRRSGGMGLGLSIVKATAEQHGGRLDISSQVGQGTIVSLFLPIQSS